MGIVWTPTVLLTYAVLLSYFQKIGVFVFQLFDKGYFSLELFDKGFFPGIYFRTPTQSNFGSCLS